MINSSSVGWNLKPGGRSELVFVSILFKNKKKGIWKERWFKGEEGHRKRRVFEMFARRGLRLLWLKYSCRIIVRENGVWLGDALTLKAFKHRKKINCHNRWERGQHVPLYLHNSFITRSSACLPSFYLTQSNNEKSIPLG